MFYVRDDEEDELVEEVDEAEDDEVASLDDDLLSEVIGEEDVIAPVEIEGFGIVEEGEEEEEKEKEEESDDIEGTVSLEDDAEDVDYDSFDDVDEL